MKLKLFACVLLLVATCSTALGEGPGVSQGRGARIDSLAPGYDFALAVRQGKIDGVSVIEKFGHNHDVDIGVEDLWEGGGTYTYPTTATACYLMSTSATATQEITIQGLDVYGAMQTATADVLGTTPVLITDGATTPTTLKWWRIYRAWNSDTTDVIGNVYIAQTNGNTAGTPTTGTVALVNSDGAIPENQTLMALYTVPLGYTLYLQDFHCGSGKAVSITTRLRVREFGKVFRTKQSPAMYQANYDKTFHGFLPIPARSDVKLQVESDTNNAEVNGGFFGFLVDEE